VAQITSSDVTYTAITGTGIAGPSSPLREHMYTILIPASGATNVLYTSGGIPLTIAKLGCPASLQKFIIIDAASSTGYVAKFDYGATTIRLYLTQNTTAASTTTPLVEVSTAATVASTTLRVLAQGW